MRWWMRAHLGSMRRICGACSGSMRRMRSHPTMMRRMPCGLRERCAEASNAPVVCCAGRSLLCVRVRVGSDAVRARRTAHCVDSAARNALTENGQREGNASLTGAVEGSAGGAPWERRRGMMPALLFRSGRRLEQGERDEAPLEYGQEPLQRPAGGDLTGALRRGTQVVCGREGVVSA